MLDKLYYFQSILGSLLTSGAEWNTLDINYEKPHVQRVWRQIGDYRISLHRIFPCEIHECFFHPHPWPSAIKIESGRYEMSIGYGSGLDPKTNITRLILPAGSYYEMTDFDAWHSVRPLDIPVMSLMITGKPWNRIMPKSDKIKLSSLSNQNRDEIMDYFINKYPNNK